MTTIKITSLQKNAPAESIPVNQEWNTNDLEFGRKLILEQKKEHMIKSKWFLIFLNGILVFNSNFIHGRKYEQIPTNYLSNEQN